MKIISRVLSIILCLAIFLTANIVGVEAASIKIDRTEKLVKDNVTASSVELRWRKVSKATGYKVYQVVDGKLKAIKTVKTNKYVVEDLTASETYKFAVKTYRKYKGETYWSSNYRSVTVTTDKMGKTPTPKATATKNSVTLTWSEVEGATGYRIYQYSPSKDKYVVKASIKDANTYTVTSLKEDNTYKFKIKPYAKTSKGVVWNKASSAVTVQTIDRTKAKFTEPSIGTKGVTLYWGKVENATAYKLYQVVDGDLVTVASGIKKTNYKVERLESGKEYTFVVRGYKKVDGKVTWFTKSEPLTVKIKTSETATTTESVTTTKPTTTTTNPTTTTKPTTTTTTTTTKPTTTTIKPTTTTTKPTTTTTTTTKPTTTATTTTKVTTTAKPITTTTTTTTTTKPTTTTTTTTTTRPTTTTTTQPITLPPSVTTTIPVIYPTTTTTQPTTQENLTAYRIAKYKTILDSDTLYFKISSKYSDGSTVPIEFAMKNGNMFMETTAEGLTMRIYYDKAKNKMTAYADFLAAWVYYNVPENEMKDMDMTEMLEIMQIGEVGFVTVSREKFNGKSVICESFLNSKTGYTMRYYFDGETLVGFERLHPKKADEIIYVETVSNTVKDTMFDPPKSTLIPPKPVLSLDEWLSK